jgi:hypothetical protein
MFQFCSSMQWKIGIKWRIAGTGRPDKFGA